MGDSKTILTLCGDKKTMKRAQPLKPFLTLGFLLFLAGCGFLPLPVTVASIVLDGISLATTEKTVADHGLSFVAGRDCALWRGMTGGDLCRDDPGEGVLSASNEEDGFDEDLMLAAADDDETEDAAPGEETAIAALARTAPMAVEKVETRTLPPPAAATKEADRPDAYGFHYVLASFTNPGNAERMVRRNQDIKTRAVTAMVLGKTVYRIVVGPFAPLERKAVRKNLAASGFPTAWGLELRKHGKPNVLLAAAR